MDIQDILPDNPFAAVVDVSDKSPTAAEPAAYLPPKYFDDGVVEEGDYLPIQNPDTGELTKAVAYNSGDAKQKRIRLSGGVEGFEPGVSRAVVDFNPQKRDKQDRSLPADLQEYKQFLIERIAGGAQDLTYGPGSPGANAADMREFIGDHDNRLKTGQVALSPSDNNLFTQEEKDRYGIADTRGQPNTEGHVERYYGPEASGKSIREAIGQYPKLAGSPTGESVQATGDNLPQYLGKDKSGAGHWSDGSMTFNDGTVSTPMGNMRKLTSADGKYRYVNIDPQKQPIPDIPANVNFDSPPEEKDTALARLSPADRISVKEYATGRRSPMTLRGRVDTAYTRLAPYVHLYDQNYDPSEFPIKQQTRMEFGTSKVNTPGGQIRSFNQALMHTGNLWDLMQKLPGDDVQKMNQFKNVVGKYIKGEPYVTDYEQQVGFVVNEIGRALKGSAIDQPDINRMLTNVGASSSRTQLESNIKNVLIKTIEGGMESLDGAYKGVMNEDLPTKKIVYPETAEALRKMGVKDFVHRPLGESKTTSTASKTYPKPTDAINQHLSQNPQTRDEYDATFGAGASDAVLGPR